MTCAAPRKVQAVLTADWERPLRDARVQPRVASQGYHVTTPTSFDLHKIRGKQRDPNPEDHSLIRKTTSTCKGVQPRVASQGNMAQSPYNILDFRGFDSSRILI